MADIFYMPSVIISFADPIRMVLSRAVARHNNWGGGGGGGYIHIFMFTQPKNNRSDAKFERPETGRLPEVVPRG